MSRGRGRAPLDSLVALRRQAATVVELCDLAVGGKAFDREQALRELPGHLRRLAFRMTRGFAALSQAGYE